MLACSMSCPRKSFIDFVSICESLIKRIEIEPFLVKMVTGEKERVIDEDVMRKGSWSKARETS